ncbi:hypothetical protein [Hymenobacter properus]|uniref:DUF481 domain-containing protein n=1 Tax=Hymenobacter properus TaxID=2791026 RepID=A0A931BFD8_9BACT|nr:hypothetical protein [Hymenobacter properus]MBF9141443.1 hypothetical protein [Hymenobacter properus]MBR7720252.1 hypothetical protein [Microvirga sp. SRT04]
MRFFYRTAVLLVFLGQCLSGRPAAAQDVGSGLPTGSSATPADASAAHGGFTAALSYGSNSSFFGRTQTTRYPYTAGELIYKSRWGVWGSAVGYNLLNTSTFLDETDLSAGWDGDLSKTVDASVSYSRFLFAPNSPLVKSSVNNSIDGYVGWDWGYVYTRLNAAYLFGETSDFFLVLDNSRNFEFEKVLTDKGYLSIEPRVSVTAGTQRFAETSLVQQVQRGNGNGRGNSGSGKTTLATTTKTRFQVLNYELRVPVTYSLGVVALQVAWRYAIPVNLLPEDASGARSYFTTSLSLNL